MLVLLLVLMLLLVLLLLLMELLVDVARVSGSVRIWILYLNACRWCSMRERVAARGSAHESGQGRGGGRVGTVEREAFHAQIKPLLFRGVGRYIHFDHIIPYRAMLIWT